MKDHKCWASSHQVDIRAAKSQMYEMVAKDPTRSLLEIYEVVRQKYTAQMDPSSKLLFLQEFPSFLDMKTALLAQRRKFIPPDPKTMIEINIDLPVFLTKAGENVVKGDQVLADGRRIILFTTKEHLKILARARQILGDGTFPSLPPYADSHFELRYKIVCEGYDLFMATNKPSWHTEISIMEWRMKMLNPKEWGDETVLVLASELLHVDIQIIPAFGEVTIIKSSSESSQKQLFSLFYFSEVDFYSGHYQSVKPSLPVSNSPSLAASFSPSLPISFSLDDIEVTDVISLDQHDHQLEELELTEETIQDIQIVVTDGR